MRCNIVFHPTTMTMSRCCNLLFVKRRCQDITCSVYVDQPALKPPENTRMTEKNKNQTSRLSIDLLLTMEETPPLSSPPCCLTTCPKDNTDERHRRRPCRTRCTGTRFYYYRSGGSHAPQHKTCFTGRAFD